MSDEDFRNKMREAVQEFSEDTPVEDRIWSGFAEHLYYCAGDLQDPAMYKTIASELENLEQNRKTEGNVLFYLSTQPSYYAPAIQQIGAAGMQHGNGWRRIVVEKPFGHDRKPHAS